MHGLLASLVSSKRASTTKERLLFILRSDQRNRDSSL